MSGPADKIIDLIYGRWRSQILYAGVELGVFDHVAGNRSKQADAVAAEIGAEVLPSEKGTRFHMLVCHCGDPHHGIDLLGPLRALKPQEDNVRVASYLDTQRTIDPYSPVAHFQTDLVFPELSESVITTLTSATENAPPTMRFVVVPIHGAITRVGVNDTAFPLRRPGYELDIMGRWSDAADKPGAVQWVTTLRDKLKPMARGVYASQLGETSEGLVRAAYGPSYARLAEIKKKYDPKNLLRLDQNIEPT
jgi:hypothetical protein